MEWRPIGRESMLSTLKVVLMRKQRLFKPYRKSSHTWGSSVWLTSQKTAPAKQHEETAHFARLLWILMEAWERKMGNCQTHPLLECISSSLWCNHNDKSRLAINFIEVSDAEEEILCKILEAVWNLQQNIKNAPPPDQLISKGTIRRTPNGIALKKPFISCTQGRESLEWILLVHFMYQIRADYPDIMMQFRVDVQFGLEVPEPESWKCNPFQILFHVITLGLKIR